MGIATAMTGASIKRREDPRLITGNATYVDDITLTGQTYMAFVRSPYAHARITSIDTSAAKKLPGIFAVITGDEINGKTAPLPTVTHPTPAKVSPHYAMAKGKVNYVGEIIAAVVSDDRYRARDAADLVQVEYEVLPAVVDVEQAASDKPTVIHEDVGSNVSYDWTIGTPQDEMDAIFASAEVVVKQRFAAQRLAPSAMEPRAVLAQYIKGEEQLNMWTSTQIPHILKSFLALTIGHPEHKTRIIAPEVGGGFGAKLNVYAEEVIVAYASRKTGRPVKWVETRSESMLATIHGRGQVSYVESAATRDGKLLAVRATLYQDIGAYQQLLTPVIGLLTQVMVSGPYNIKSNCRLLSVFTNKTPTDAYRGAGRPEATYLLERIVDMTANELGMDPAEFRRMNLVKAEEYPFTSPYGYTYDSIDYIGSLNKALDVADYAGMRREQEAARAAGRRVGIGFSSYVEICGMGPSSGMFTKMGWESSTVRFDLTGKVTVFTGASPHGQGQETSFAQIVGDRLGLPIEDITVKHGDTANTPYGLGTYGSRGTAVGSGALMLAVDTIIEKAKKIAGFLLEADEGDVVLEDGKFSVAGAPSGKTVTIQEVAFRAIAAGDMPVEIERGLEATRFFDPSNFTFPSGTHICMIEIDTETGDPKILKYIAVDDCGNIINPMLANGQVHGGLAQGIAQALYEEVVYDENGQLISGSLMDYTVPTASELPWYTLDHTITPSPVNPLGVKGIGEAGTIGSTPAVSNAVMDALKGTGVKDIDMPFRPEKLWAAMNSGNGHSSNGNGYNNAAPSNSDPTTNAGSVAVEGAAVQQHFGDDNA